tara:strand:+ start:120 stop:308 length:189 start_codon:yes stop_codon:yes gene_type:complete
MSKKYKVPVFWTVCGFVTVEADNKEDAAHEAMGVDLDCIDDKPEYLPNSFEVDEQAIEEVSQ